jgi:hypothetical protein
MTLESYVMSATLALARRTPVGLGEGEMPDASFGEFAFAPAGDGRLLAFTREAQCGRP